KELSQLLFIVALDNKGIVEFRLANLDILHSKELAKVAKEPSAIDGKAEAVFVHLGGTHSGVGRATVFAVRLRIGVERNRPRMMVNLHLAALPETAVEEIAPDLVAQLPPDFILRRTENLKQAHG